MFLTSNYIFFFSFLFIIIVLIMLMAVFFVFHIAFGNTVKYSLFINFRDSRSQVTYKKATSKNLAKFTQKNMCRGLFFNKNVGLQSATL